ncbi:MAG: hypothetical protein NWE78_07155 [Candidatus Bathyarchaeota archaeon]|nr:hypothetical protein [Candidatus Bathyarchaeota archaeon]
MKLLTLIYWIRAALGLVIGLLCGLYIYYSDTSELFNFFTLLTGISFAMLFYLATYYVLKLKFYARVEKSSKLVRQGIGIYFFAWIVSWTLIVTLLMPTVSVNIYDSSSGNFVEDQEFFVLVRNAATSQLVRNITIRDFEKVAPLGSYRITLLPPGEYTFELEIIGNFTIESQNHTLSIGWLDNLNVSFLVTPFSG